MSEVVFLVEEDPDGGYLARALGEPIFTNADDWDQLRQNVRDALSCHCDDDSTRPRVIRLHLVRDEVLAL
ncbi:MAG: 2-oxoisovalerate dehydrogenase [Candidatus Hydrogenedentota bacterium]